MKKQAIWTLVLPMVLLAFTADLSYEEEIKQWHQKRETDLKKEEGWLNLAGLFWLKEGENTFGGSDENKIVFPSDHSDAKLGKIILKNGTVSVEALPSAQIFAGDKAVQKLQLFPYIDKPIILTHKSLRWFVIQRGDKYAIRLRDLESPALSEFKGIDMYSINPDWRIKAKFVPTPGKKIAITDITGRTSDQESPGRLAFSVNGTEQSLEATGNLTHLHFVFADQTNKHETYGGGRFLDAAGPDAAGYTYLDFNKATNPPCAFTPYATCPTPPKANKLSVAILAGEKRYGDH